MILATLSMVAVLLPTTVENVADGADNSVPTVVFGAAATADGSTKAFEVIQPAGAPNPLGDPIPEAVTSPQTDNSDLPTAHRQKTSAAASISAKDVAQTAQGSLPQEAQQLGKDFQNTVLEANDRIYDIQSYPTQDIKLMENPAFPQTITSPNVNN